MRRVFMLVVAPAVAALALVLVGCGSDSDGGSSNNGGSSGAAGGGSTSQCVANNAEFTHAQFLAQTEPGKACSDASDASTVCASDMPLIGGTCGKGCLGMGDDAAQATCVADCIKTEIAKSKAAPLSDDCMACYTADVECARKNCLTACGLAPTSEACYTCRNDNGCVDEFYSCSGLPEPSAP